MTPKARRERIAQIRVHRARYIQGMRDRIEDEDWHAVMDWAADLRELDVEMRCLMDDDRPPKKR